ncbi:hypothetical protein [Maledivibacter halophilus]|uniref:Uncharacterized protein n=1 Tax=Maledivibacter halophilus TaxID=36842 RepID=A0A1T5MB65_9FIRM|nr:hypothetical protein [Maledivibacter halophilus]SKC85442.1 hypothetical protein SAMN02194393_04356 [Maledivibacter halophilus]
MEVLNHSSITVTERYLVILSYPGLEITLDCGKNYNLNKGLVIELDIIGSNIKTSRQIGLDNTKEKVMSLYNLEKEIFYDSSDEEIPSVTIRGFKRLQYGDSYMSYEEYCYIQDSENPTALLFLFKENKVVRIILRHLTAG